MPGFDYGNARVRAMRSRLLSRREMELLAEAGTLKGFIAGLTKTAYRKAIEAALAHASGMESISQALREDLSDTLGVVRHFYSEDEVFIIGGGEVFAQALPLAWRIYLTQVHARVACDTFFPEVNLDHWVVRRECFQPKDEHNDYAFTFQMLTAFTR